MRKILVATSVLLAAISLRAGMDGYLMLSVFSPGQLPSPAYSVYGGRLSLIYGDCQELYGLDVGVAGAVQESAYGIQVNAVWNGVDVDMSGAQIALLNTVSANAFGLQAGILDISGEMTGCQLGLLDFSDDCYGAQLGLFAKSRDLHGFQLALLDMADDVKGCQLGVFNAADDFRGCQLGVFNVADASAGCQLGVFNAADEFRGCQLGVLNVAEKLYGCQIGLLNIETACDIPAWLLLNIGW